MKKILVCVLGGVLLTGCSQRIADLTVASTKNYNINGGKFVNGPRVTGEDSVPVFLVPLGLPNVKEAADTAIEKDKCAVGLTDVVVTENNYSFLVGILSFEVEGTLVYDRSLPGCAG